MLCDLCFLVGCQFTFFILVCSLSFIFIPVYSSTPTFIPLYSSIFTFITFSSSTLTILFYSPMFTSIPFYSYLSHLFPFIHQLTLIPFHSSTITFLLIIVIIIHFRSLFSLFWPGRGRKGGRGVHRQPGKGLQNFLAVCSVPRLR